MSDCGSSYPSTGKGKALEWIKDNDGGQMGILGSEAITTSKSGVSLLTWAILECVVACSAICILHETGNPRYSMTELSFLFSLPLLCFSLP